MLGKTVISQTTHHLFVPTYHNICVVWDYKAQSNKPLSVYNNVIKTTNVEKEPWQTAQN